MARPLRTDYPGVCYHITSALYVRTPQGNLSRFMQGLLMSFTLSINRRRRPGGHLLEGRFRMELVEREKYGNEVSHYLHLNPVRTRAARLFGVSVAGLTRSRDRVVAGTAASELDRLVGAVQRQLSIA